MVGLVHNGPSGVTLQRNNADSPSSVFPEAAMVTNNVLSPGGTKTDLCQIWMPGGLRSVFHWVLLNVLRSAERRLMNWAAVSEGVHTPTTSPMRITIRKVVKHVFMARSFSFVSTSS